jgi:phenylacetic acid degradation operon negative regulatory protein
LTFRWNIVILELMEVSVNQERRAVERPNSFIFTLYGDLVHGGEQGGGGSLWVGALIALMAPFGVSAAAVRQAVSRLSRQGWLAARREGNRAYYSVTARGARRITELSPRIYGPVIDWDGYWRVLVFTGGAPRDVRDRLRGELRVLGWAPLSAATWIAPGDSLEAARSTVESNGLAESVHLFEGTYRGPLSDRQLVERCWNLEEIGTAYRAFVDRYRPRLTRERDGAALDDESAFVERLWLVHDYRRFAYLDPGLPSELVPAHWPGTTAAALFREYYAVLDRKSLRYFRSKARDA